MAFDVIAIMVEAASTALHLIVIPRHVKNCDPIATVKLI